MTGYALTAAAVIAVAFILAAVCAAAATRRGVRADRRTRMSYRGGLFFINGESFESTDEAKTLAASFADTRELAADTLGSDEARELLEGPVADWYAAGWVHLGDPRSRDS